MAGLPQPGIAFHWIALQRLLEERFNLLPAFHIPSYLPPTGTRRFSSSKKFSVKESWAGARSHPVRLPPGQVGDLPVFGLRAASIFVAQLSMASAPPASGLPEHRLTSARLQIQTRKHLIAK